MSLIINQYTPHSITIIANTKDDVEALKLVINRGLNILDNVPPHICKFRDEINQLTIIQSHEC